MNTNYTEYPKRYYLEKMVGFKGNGWGFNIFMVGEPDPVDDSPKIWYRFMNVHTCNFMKR